MKKKKQELLLEQQADRDHTGSDIAVDFADWCLKKLGKHGDEKITKELLQLDDKFKSYVDSQSDTDTLDFTLRIGLNYMRYWENSHDIDTITGWVERYVNTLLKQLRHSFGKISKHPERNSRSNPTNDGKQYRLIFDVATGYSFLDSCVNLPEMSG